MQKLSASRPVSGEAMLSRVEEIVDCYVSRDVFHYDFLKYGAHDGTLGDRSVVRWVRSSAFLEYGCDDSKFHNIRYSGGSIGPFEDHE